jgi:hypothetical protein
MSYGIGMLMPAEYRQRSEGVPLAGATVAIPDGDVAGRAGEAMERA